MEEEVIDLEDENGNTWLRYSSANKPIKKPTEIYKNIDTTSNLVYYPEKVAKYEIGDHKLIKEVVKRYKPKLFASTQGALLFRITVLEDGTVGGVEMVRGDNRCDSCIASIIHILNNLEHNFIPAMYEGKNVGTYYMFNFNVYNDVNNRFNNPIVRPMPEMPKPNIPNGYPR